MREQCKPVVRGVTPGAEKFHTVAHEVRGTGMEALHAHHHLPVNPLLNIAPILPAFPPVNVANATQKFIVVSPLIGGQAVKEILRQNAAN